MKTLATLGIAAIHLESDKNRVTLPDGSVSFGKGHYTRSDGSKGELADVALKYSLLGAKTLFRSAFIHQGSTPRCKGLGVIAAWVRRDPAAAQPDSLEAGWVSSASDILRNQDRPGHAQSDATMAIFCCPRIQRVCPADDR